MPASLAVAATAPTLERDDAVEILMAALRDDPAVRGLYPADMDYVRYFPGLALAYGDGAFDAGSVDRDADGHAVALWYRPGQGPSHDAVMRHLATSVPASRLDRLTPGLPRQADRRPSEPHWHLSWMGVVPEAQGMGIGGTLLREGLARADAARLPVYLEATTRRAVAFFARHGFETRAAIDIPGHPPIVGMWRPAS
jgi:ribosomal protein S18 acetylase RimI-like enzyme